jgi:hypothetical protein
VLKNYEKLSVFVYRVLNCTTEKVLVDIFIPFTTTSMTHTLPTTEIMMCWE